MRLQDKDRQAKMTNPNKPKISLGQNKSLADRLRKFGFGRIVNSSKVRSALGIPVWDSAGTAGDQHLLAYKDSPYSTRLKQIPKSAPEWQRLHVLESGLEEHRDDPTWLRDLMGSAVKFGRLDLAKEAGQRILDLNAQKVDDLCLLAHASQLLGDFAAATEAESEAVKLAGKSGDRDVANFGIGGFFQRRGDWDLAAAAYARQTDAILANPRVNAGSNLGSIAFRTGLALDRCLLWGEAEHYYRSALFTDVDNYYWAYKFALSLERQRKWVEAADIYDYAVTLKKNPSRKYHRYRAAYCLLQVGQFEASCKAFLGDSPSEMAPAKPLSPSEAGADEVPTALPATEYWKRKAELYRRRGDAAGEIAALRQVASRSNDHPTKILERIGELEFQQGSYEASARSLIDSRLFQTPDGINLKPYLKRNQKSFSAKYAEYLTSRPLLADTVLFESFHADSVGCHPLAIFEQMLSDTRFDGFTYVWVIKPGGEVPAVLQGKREVVVVERQSDAYLRYLATAQWLVNNVSFPAFFTRRSGQRYLNTWHGTPIKTLGKDMKPNHLQHSNVARNFLQATHLTSPCRWTTDVLLDRYDVRDLFEGKVAEVGSARVDRSLRSSPEDIQLLRARLGVNAEQPVVLYAPTWRGLQGAGGTDIDLTREALDQLASVEGVQVLFRGHHLAEASLNEAGLSDRLVPSDIDTNALLAVVDLLVTDYSSIFFDFLPFDRPIVFHVPDEQEYRNERGLYFDVNELPGVACYEATGLASAVSSAMRKDEMQERRAAWTARFASYEDGQASRRTVEFFFFGQDEWSLPPRTSKPRILMRAAFIPNGITTSIENLISSIDPEQVSLTVLLEASVFARDESRQEQVAVLPDHVAVIGRAGSTAYTIEQRWVMSTFSRTQRYLSRAHRQVVDDAMRSEHRRLFGTLAFDSLVEFDGYSPFWVNFGAAACDKTSKVLYQHNDLFSEWRTRFPELSAVFSRYAEFDRLVSISSSIRDLNRSNLAEMFHVPEDKFVFAHNQMNPVSIFRRASEPLDSDVAAWLERTEGHTFVTVGRLSIEKAQSRLLECFAVVSRQVSARLIVIGSGFLESELRALAVRLGIADRVLFTGQRSNPLNIVKKSDTFVMTSKHEGQPMVLGEAMVLGKRIISTDLPGVRDLIGNDFGQLFNYNKQVFVDAMINAAGEQDERSAFDYCGFTQNAIQEFSDITGVHLSLKPGFLDGATI